jgi:creatinine amidohydrolase
MLTHLSTAEEIANAGADTVFLPIGSMEQHGAHLPIGTDYMIAGAVAAAACGQIGGLLLPALPISTCREHRGGAGSVWLNAVTFIQVLKDIAESLRVQRMKRLILVVGHGGVFAAGPAVREINSDNEGIKAIRVDLTDMCVDERMGGLLAGSGNLHACEAETSLMLYLHESAVRADRMKDFVPEIPRDFLNYAPLLHFSPSGVWGRPSLATREKGERIFNMLVEQSVDYIRQVSGLLDAQIK